MITKQMIHDEARRRMALVHGGSYGSNIEQKAMNSVMVHLAYPSAETLHRLRCHLALVTASNVLERSLPDDYRDEKHWPMPEPVSLIDDVNVVEGGALIANLSNKIDALADQFHEHGHKAQLSDGTVVEWDDFVLKSQVGVGK